MAFLHGADGQGKLSGLAAQSQQTADLQTATSEPKDSYNAIGLGAPQPYARGKQGPAD